MVPPDPAPVCGPPGFVPSLRDHIPKEVPVSPLTPSEPGVLGPSCPPSGPRKRLLLPATPGVLPGSVPVPNTLVCHRGSLVFRGISFSGLEIIKRDQGGGGVPYERSSGPESRSPRLRGVLDEDQKVQEGVEERVHLLPRQGRRPPPSPSQSWSVPGHGSDPLPTPDKGPETRGGRRVGWAGEGVARQTSRPCPPHPPPSAIVAHGPLHVPVPTGI